MPADAKSIFLAAADKPAADRAAFLDEACAGDAVLRQRVEALLRAHDQPSDSPGTGDYAPSAVPAFETGSVFAGRYKLREVLGEGGMGTVYVADQAEPVQRRVALKVIRTGLDSFRLLARFEQERQALALMDHPNIAKVFDAGVVDGVPYFAMELIKGVPITRYCDEAKLTPRQRLELFVPVCQAVQHAHQKGIIHRDLKPSNVLVGLYDGRPVPKVIDFGVAKATGPRLTERSVYTEVGMLVGTLEYMAPEQAELNNLDIDTRADVYALGVILYELLTGAVPFSRRELQAAGFAEMLRIIKEVEPPKPSTKLSGSGSLPSVAASRGLDPRKLEQQLRGDLDWIAMKCLEKERSRRYETANQLALEVQRYLANEPVLAGPVSTAYRVRKFVRRNRGPVVAAGLLFVALLAGIAGTSWQAYRAGVAEADAKDQARVAGEERDEKEKARQDAMAALRATADDVIEQLLSSKPTLGPAERGFLAKTLQRWQAFAATKGDGVQARAIRAEAAHRVAYLRSLLGDTKAALAGCREAIALMEQVVAERPDVPRYRQDLALSHNNLGMMALNVDQFAVAEAAFRAAIDLQTRLVAEAPAEPSCRQELVRSYSNLCVTLTARQQLADATTAIETALTLGTQLVADFPATALYRRELAHAYVNQAKLLSVLGQWPEAAAASRAAIQHHERLVSDFLGVPTYRLEHATSLNNLGITLATMGQPAEADAAVRAAVAILERLTADYPAVPDYRNILAEAWSSLSSVLRERGQRADAVAASRAAVVGWEKLAAEYPVKPAYRQSLGRGQDRLGNLLIEMKKPTEAEAAYRAALAVREKLLAEFPSVAQHRSDCADTVHNLGGLVFNSGNAIEAETLFRRALALRTQLVADHPTVPLYRQFLANHHRALGNILERRGQLAEAETHCRAALALREKLAAEFPKVAEHRGDEANSYNDLSTLLMAAKKPTEAAAALRTAMAIKERLVAEFPAMRHHAVDLARNYGMTGSMNLDRGDLPKALEWFTRAIAVLEPAYRADPGLPNARLFLRICHDGRARALVKLNRHAEALPEWDQVLALGDGQNRQSIQLERADCLARAGRASDAVAAVEELATPQASASVLYTATVVVAVAAAAAGNPDADAHAAHAVALLRRAIVKSPRSAAKILNDAQLAALRSRADYADLLWDLADGLPPSK